jgi:hypothetical protein
MTRLRTTLATIALAGAAHAEPVAVQTKEGPTYGTLALASLDGTRLADGELAQTLDGENVVSRLTFHFRDGSFFDEIVVFSQERVFRLLSYTLDERGPSFTADKRISFDRKSGRYRVDWKERGESKEKTYEDEIEIPEDVYNGMAGLIMRNAGEKARGHFLAFVPEPYVLDLSVVLEGHDTFRIGGETRKARRYLLDLEVPGFTGVLAKAVGKTPPDVHWWIADPVPAFIKFEGAMYLNGPIWRIEQTTARWGEKAK